METQPLVIQCPVCGMTLQIPPEYRNRKGRCAKCGAEIAPSNSEPSPDIAFDIPDLDIRPKKTAPKPPEPPNARRVVAVSFAWAVLAAAIVGTLAVAAAFVIITGDYRTAGALAAWGMNGGLTAFFITSTYLIVRNLDLSFMAAALLGAAIAFVTGAVDYLAESVFVAQPDYPYYYFGVSCILGGAILGGFASYVRSWLAGD